MEDPVHTLSDLFKQLGLPDDSDSIESFIHQHKHMKDTVKLSEAPFWTDAQRRFLKEELEEDADWAELVDELNTRLH
ncbi:DUF2789 domain-containing protein [uncultured Marinobacter sp.]|uniref:DUF2789 domain-containing protein n=1 Tax=uncultured Marinobacter sp. TaxID=187379 RepID=UPI0030DABF66|tara:strand:- start:27 stop:257 length:231 start_codon:yes stop_codon:yes gene_type:complete